MSCGRGRFDVYYFVLFLWDVIFWISKLGFWPAKMGVTFEREMIESSSFDRVIWWNSVKLFSSRRSVLLFFKSGIYRWVRPVKTTDQRQPGGYYQLQMFQTCLGGVKLFVGSFLSRYQQMKVRLYWQIFGIGMSLVVFVILRVTTSWHGCSFWQLYWPMCDFFLMSLSLLNLFQFEYRDWHCYIVCTVEAGGLRNANW